ncbi:MAG TPA: energy transducer TonB [Sphingomicrobium sp.]|nr:energy transducer TonB [Sphingomicrobium sp.]
MYRPTLNRTDRGGAIAAVLAIHAGLLFAFLHMGGRIDLIAEPQRRLETIDITEPQPPPEEPPVIEERPQPQREQAREEEGAASPENIRSQATPVVAPRPKIELPVTSPVVTTETPREGADPTQGAADVPGPGTGAGGIGTGPGAGGAGSGTGGGGTGAIAARPSLVRGITNRDYPDAIQRSWPRGGQIFLRLRIEPNGRASQCDVMRSFGNSAADQWTCRLIMDRGQFRPAVNDRGVPVADWFGYIQSDTGRMVR